MPELKARVSEDLAQRFAEMAVRRGRMKHQSAILDLRREAKALADLRSHIRDLEEIYARTSMTFIRRLMGAGALSQDVKSIDISEVEDGFVVRFSLRGK